jgi:hypothetical protein
VMMISSPCSTSAIMPASPCFTVRMLALFMSNKTSNKVGPVEEENGLWVDRQPGRGRAPRIRRSSWIRGEVGKRQLNPSSRRILEPSGRKRGTCLEPWIERPTAFFLL